MLRTINIKVLAIVLCLVGTGLAQNKINLATQVTGTLPAANGGTAVTNLTFSGSSHKVASVSGSLTNTHCVNVDASGNLTDAGAACGTSTTSGTVTHTAGSLTSTQLVCGAGGADIAVCNLSGDSTTSASAVVTVVKVNGVAYAASPSTNTVPVITASNTSTYTSLPNCADSAGNHYNYDSSAHTFSCGTSGVYVIPVQFESAPTASQTARHVIPGGVGTVSIATNCPNCTFSIGTAATATTTFTLKKNGSSFGTVAVTSGGSVTWTVTTSTFTSGDVITVVAPASPDATAAQIAMSLYATR